LRYLDSTAWTAFRNFGISALSGASEKIRHHHKEEEGIRHDHKKEEE